MDSDAELLTDGTFCRIGFRLEILGQLLSPLKEQVGEMEQQMPNAGGVIFLVFLGPHEDIFRDSIFRIVSAIGENAVTKMLACNDFSHLQLSGPFRSLLSVSVRSLFLGGAIGATPFAVVWPRSFFPHLQLSGPVRSSAPFVLPVRSCWGHTRMALISCKLFADKG